MELFEFMARYNKAHLIETIKSNGYKDLMYKIFNDVGEENFTLPQIKEYLETINGVKKKEKGQSFSKFFKNIKFVCYIKSDEKDCDVLELWEENYKGKRYYAYYQGSGITWITERLFYYLIKKTEQLTGQKIN